MGIVHEYGCRLVWEGNSGGGTSSYQGYGRQWRVKFDGKPDLVGSADPAYRGEIEKYNPEDLLVAALSSCHMLSYLALCSRNKISVLAYTDEAIGLMTTTAEGGGKFESVTLRPKVVISDNGRESLAKELHERAHSLCFIASSVNFAVHHYAIITVGV
jgi:organic hydroperoxide reductase OsmC/OhrA